jgi:hypothetical protein
MKMMFDVWCFFLNFYWLQVEMKTVITKHFLEKRNRWRKSQSRKTCTAPNSWMLPYAKQTVTTSIIFLNVFIMHVIKFSISFCFPYLHSFFSIVTGKSGTQAVKPLPKKSQWFQDTGKWCNSGNSVPHRGTRCVVSKWWPFRIVS